MLIEDARKMAEITTYCDHCTGSPISGHLDGCPLSRILAALELIDRLGFTFEEQADGLHVISRPKRRALISERAVRVVEAAERMAAYPPVVNIGGVVDYVPECGSCGGQDDHLTGCPWQVLKAALSGEGSA